MEQLALSRPYSVQGVDKGLIFFFLMTFTVEMAGICHILAAPSIVP